MLILYIVMSCASFALFFFDKWAAQSGAWRIPELWPLRRTDWRMAWSTIGCPSIQAQKTKVFLHDDLVWD